MKCVTATRAAPSRAAWLGGVVAAALLLMPLCALAEDTEPLWDGTGQTEPGPIKVLQYEGSICRLVTFEGHGVASLPSTPLPGTEPIGICFSSASQWYTLTSPPGRFDPNTTPSGNTVAIWRVGAGGIRFEAPVSRVSLYFASTRAVKLLAYDAAGNLLASDIAAGNNSSLPLVNWTQLSVDVGHNRISHVWILAGERSKTAIDNVEACMLDEVPIDLKPENAENAVDPFNLGSNKPVEVAVFSTPDLDATLIAPESVELGDPLLEATIPALSEEYADLNGDGLEDVVFYFGSARDFGEAGALNECSAEVLLTGWTLDNSQVFGLDDVEIVGSSP